MREVYATFEPMASQQGWDDWTKLAFAWAFILYKDMEDEFREYLREEQDEEIEASKEQADGYSEQ